MKNRKSNETPAFNAENVKLFKTVLKHPVSDFENVVNKISDNMNRNINMNNKIRTTKIDNNIETIENVELQIEKYLAWKESGKLPENIYFVFVENDFEKFFYHPVPRVDLCRLRFITENSLLQFWHLNEDNVKEFILFQYQVEHCNFKGIVQDISETFTMGLNILRESKSKYTVSVSSGNPLDVRNNVKRQLKQDMEIFYGVENDFEIANAAASFRGLDLAAVRAFVGCWFGWISPLWNSRYSGAAINVVGMLFLIFVLNPIIPNLNQFRSVKADEIRVIDNLSEPEKSALVQTVSLTNQQVGETGEPGVIVTKTKNQLRPTKPVGSTEPPKPETENCFSPDKELNAENEKMTNDLLSDENIKSENKLLLETLAEHNQCRESDE